MTITLKTHDKAQSMSILRYLKEHGAKYKTRIEDGMNNLGGMVMSNESTYIIEIEDDDHSINVLSDLLNLR